MEELIPIVAIFFVIGVPVMAIAARFALRPLLRDLVNGLGKGKTDPDLVAQLTERLARIEGHVVEQDRRLDQLVDAELFRRQLEEKAGGLEARPTAREVEGRGLSRPEH